MHPDAARVTAVVPAEKPLVGFCDLNLIGERLISHWGRAGPVGGVTSRAACQGRGPFGGLAHTAHPVVHPSCDCGYRVDFEPHEHRHVRYTNSEVLQAVVSVWGRVRLAREGMRAEWMRLEALSSLPTSRHQPRLGSRLLARRLGVEHFPDREGLRAAAVRYGTLAVPAHLPARASVELLERTESGDPPRFRYVSDPVRGSVQLLSERVFGAWLYGDYWLDPFTSVADIFTPDDQGAVAVIAQSAIDGRAEAEHQLRWWAAQDDWQLEIADAQGPLVDLNAYQLPPKRHLRCARCNANHGLNFLSGMALAHRGYARTRCRCGSRIAFAHDDGRLGPKLC